MPVLYEPDAPEDSFELTPDCNELGGPHGEVPAGRVLFRAASRRTGLARFRASGSPVITPWRRLVSGWRRGRVGRP
jgi:hypothetical protein